MRDLRETVVAETLGDAWIGVAKRILDEGAASQYDGLPIVELAQVTLDIASPDPHDAIIAEHGDPERLAWMHANFTDHARVAELGQAESYATRLYDYGRSGRDQIAWVIERLRSDPASRSATITTFQPLTDTSYIPCVSLLDFWMPDGRARTGGLRAQHRLRDERLWQPRRAGADSAAGGDGARCAGGAADDDRQVRPYLCPRDRGDDGAGERPTGQLIARFGRYALTSDRCTSRATMQPGRTQRRGTHEAWYSKVFASIDLRRLSKRIG